MTEPSPETFALSPAYFQRLGRTMLWTTVVIIPASIVVGVLSGRRSAGGWVSTIVVGAITTAVLAITMYWGWKKQVARWQTFRVAISSDQVTRTQEGFDDVRVGASAISRMVRIPGRGLLIYTGRAQPAMVVPDTLERFEDFCALVQRFGPIEARTRSMFPRWLAIPAGLAFMGLYAAFERSADPRVKVGLGALIACLIGIGAWRWHGSPEIDQRTKKRFAWIIIVLIAPLGVQMWSAWTAPRRADREISGNRLLSLLVKTRPELHDRLRQAMIVAEKNKSDSHGSSYVNPGAAIIAEVFPGYVPICSDEAIIRYGKEMVAVLEKLEADPSEICYDWLNPQGRVVPLTGVLGKDGLNPLMDAMTGVLESALTAPQAPPDATEAESLRAHTMERLTTDASLGPVELRAPETPGFDKKRWCHTVSNIYRIILGLPERESSVVLRHIFGKASEK
jgi:hypothetical protein